MKVTAVDYIGPENVFIVYFSAPHRVDAPARCATMWHLAV
jgi:hypothetical protein